MHDVHSIEAILVSVTWSNQEYSLLLTGWDASPLQYNAHYPKRIVCQYTRTSVNVYIVYIEHIHKYTLYTVHVYVYSTLHTIKSM